MNHAERSQREAIARHGRESPLLTGTAAQEHPVIALQRTAGNAFVQQLLLARRPLQRHTAKTESTHERLRRQAATIVDALSQTVADADREGHSSITLTIEHMGGELVPGFAKHDPRVGRSTGAARVSATQVARDHLKPALDMILISGRGIWRIEFGRDERGAMSFQRMYKHTERAEPQPDEYDIPDRKRIYAEIFAETERVLKEEGIKLAGFTAEQIALWIAGGIIFRAIGLLAGAGARVLLPHLRNALRFRRTGNLTRALGTLGEAEAAEFSVLMQRAERGALGKAEQSRLLDLMQKLDRALATDVPTLRTMSRLGESAGLSKHAGKISSQAEREINDLLLQYLAGNKSPGIGTKHLAGDIFYLRGREGGRVFLRENAEGFLEILGKADKGNESAVIAAVLKQFT